MRIVHLSDLHFWHITLNPLRLMGKRLLGMGNLVLNRARKYRMERMPDLCERVKELNPDHILITGDLTTTSLEEEFEAAYKGLLPLNGRQGSMTIIPGNHDRYTRRAARHRLFEKHFGGFAPSAEYPWLRHIGERTAILGLDTSRPAPISARGVISLSQLDAARHLLEESRSKIARLIVACHYPVALPEGVRKDRGHDLQGKEHLRSFLLEVGPHLYCHGHIHAGWTFTPAALPRSLCLNPGAALRKRKRPVVQALLLEILLEGSGVEVRRHALMRQEWEVTPLASLPNFFSMEDD